MMELEDWIYFGLLMAWCIGSCLFIGIMYIVIWVTLWIFGAVPQMLLQIFKRMKGDFKNGRREKL